MEPAEWDGSNPVVPKLGSGDRWGSCERGGDQERGVVVVQEMKKKNQPEFLLLSGEI